MTDAHEPYQIVTSGPQDPEYLPPAPMAAPALHKNLEHALAVLTRVVTVAEQQQFSRETIAAARTALDNVRAQLLADRFELEFFRRTFPRAAERYQRLRQTEGAQEESCTNG